MPSPTLEVRHFSLVNEIAGTGSVTRAAERLHLTQSALSHQLRDIESRLGLQLFLRLGKRMVLTPPGERVLGAARRVLDEIVRTEDDLKMMSQHGKGVLRLCTQCNTGYHWLPPLLQSFHRKFPGVDVQIMVNATDHPIESLLEGQIDLAVVTSDVDDKRLVTAPLFEDEFVAVVAPTHPFAKRAYVEPADFAEEHLIVYKIERSNSFIFQRVLGPAGIEPDRVSTGAADGSDSRARQGRSRRQRDGTLGHRARDPLGYGQSGPHHPPRHLPPLDGRDAQGPGRAEVAKRVRVAARTSGAAREDGKSTIAEESVEHLAFRFNATAAGRAGRAVVGARPGSGGGVG